MMKAFKEHDGLNLPNIAQQVLEKWRAEKTFEASISSREGKPTYVFYEGPPSANGMPGIHHVMGRTIKDLFCRYKTQKGFQVNRKAGWDTHGLPVELGVEKELGITKEDIGKTITIEEYNKACREAVMRYTDVWNDVTEKMGYWVDMSDPYVTYENDYIESVWWLLSQLYQKNLLYKGYSIQPYSPAAGTGLSSHELNLPGCYRDVKDTSCVAIFKTIADDRLKTLDNRLFELAEEGSLHILAWTTTPWTLPSNTALTVGEKIDYVVVDTFNPYTADSQKVILAKALLNKYFKTEGAEAEMTYQPTDKLLPYRILSELKGADLVGIRYEQLLPYATPYKDADKAFQVIAGDFVTTEDGTGIVHTAPTFGADDMRVANAAGVPGMLVKNENGDAVPLVDLRGRFVESMVDPVWGLSGEPVKADYLTDAEKEAAFEAQKESLKEYIPNLSNYLSVDERIALKLKLEGKAFKVEKYQHNYPHCWRTDKPVLYYPLDSWFIRSTAAKDKMIELNKTINWKPESTGTGRFGNWLENLNDWNLSRSRYWGTPLPIWRSGPYGPLFEECVGSIEEFYEKNAYYITEECLDANGNRYDGHSLRKELGEKRLAGENINNIWNDLIRSRKITMVAKLPKEQIDLHRPMVDYVIFFRNGLVMARELDLIDVWFDSGAMPFAQWHYPFENKELVDSGKAFPADFIAEGVDQTRGWFFTLHAISTMIKGSVAYKNVLSNGLVLDKNGQKMSKRLGNGIDPFKTLAEFGPDATRWYMITNAQPWDNLKFDLEGITEVQRKYFRALHNSYSFFALYANVDKFTHSEAEIPLNERPEIDQWVISRLNTLVKEVEDAFENYEPTRAGRAIQDFVVDELSNWYVRLCRRRFWKGDYSQDKIAAYQTLYRCLITVAKLR
jgi:isoleucyl-tRNA synthetase